MKNITISLLLILLSGCISFNSPFSGMLKGPDPAKKKINEIEVPDKPVKSEDHLEEERKVLTMSIDGVETAKTLTVEPEVVGELTSSLRLMHALRRSIGEPSTEVKRTLDEMSKSILELDRHNADLRMRNAEYASTMSDMQKKILDLKSSYGKVVEENSSLMDQLSFWFWMAIVASIGIAVFVPGGTILVKRFWSKVGGLALSAGQSAVGSCKGLSMQLSKYAETLDDEQRAKFKSILKSMHPDDIKYWDKIREGRDPIAERLHDGKEFDNDKLDLIFKHARDYN